MGLPSCGVVLPPRLAPAQVIIISVAHKDEDKERVLKYCKELKQDLGVRAKIDKRDLRAGEKAWNWVKKGVPIRIEVGPREKGYSMAERDCKPIRDVIDQALFQGSLQVADIEAYYRLFACMCRLNEVPRLTYNDLDKQTLKQRLDLHLAQKEKMSNEHLERYDYTKSVFLACTQKFNAAMRIDGIKPQNLDDYTHIFTCIYQIIHIPS